MSSRPNKTVLHSIILTYQPSQTNALNKQVLHAVAIVKAAFDIGCVTVEQ